MTALDAILTTALAEALAHVREGQPGRARRCLVDALAWAEWVTA